MTTKLFWTDSHLTQFTALVTDARAHEQGMLLELDQTAFYPEGGGQPGDTGMIEAHGATLDVIAVTTGADDRIWHQVAGGAVMTGAKINGMVHQARRREMTQQHTGQHILSQAFFQLFGAETRGFRITTHGAEVDLALECAHDEIPAAMAKATDLANTVVFDNREIRTHVVTPEEAARMPLRKESFVSDCVRVVEIDEFDWSPCGGTHAKRTGEVGAIVVSGFERAKQMTRVHFLCGVRAISDYNAARETADDIARFFSVGRGEAMDAVRRLADDNKRLMRRVRELAELAAVAEAAALLDGAQVVSGLRVVTRIFDDRGLEEIKLLAHRLVAHDAVVALLAAREAGQARLVFARAANVSTDMNQLMRRACEIIGGRGGGKPDFAQGGGAGVESLEQAMRECADRIVAA